MLDRIDWINLTLPLAFPETAGKWKLEAGKGCFNCSRVTEVLMETRSEWAESKPHTTPDDFHSPADPHSGDSSTHATGVPTIAQFHHVPLLP